MVRLASDRQLRLVLVAVLMLAAVVSALVAVMVRDSAMACEAYEWTTDVPPSYVGWSCRWASRTFVEALPLAVGVAASAVGGIAMARSRTPGSALSRDGDDTERQAPSMPRALPADPALWETARKQRARSRAGWVPWPEGLWWRLPLVPLCSFVALWLSESTLLGFVTGAPVRLGRSGYGPPSGVPELGATGQRVLCAAFFVGFGLVAWWQCSLFRHRAQEPPEPSSSLVAGWLRRVRGSVRGTAVLAAVVVLALTVFVAGLDFGRGDATPPPTTNGHFDPFDIGEITWGTGRTMAPGGSFVDIAANDLMSCGIRADGELECWGQVDTVLPQGVFSGVFLNSGRNGDEGTGCVLGVQGAIQCWVSPGWASGGVWAAPHGEFVDVSAGSGHWCAVRKDGAVVCWGQGFDGHEVLAGSGFVRVTSGGVWPAYPVCALDVSGSVTCWGDELGAGLVEPPGGLFERVTAASYRPGAGPAVRLGEALLGSAVAEDGGGRAVVGDVCGIRRGGSLECWNQPGLRPLVMSGDEFQSVSLGARHGCVVARDASVRCWGNNEAGQRGPWPDGSFYWSVGDAACVRDSHAELRCSWWREGEPIRRRHPEHPYAGVPDDQVDPLAGPFRDVSVSDATSCAYLTAGYGWRTCWGDLGELHDPALKASVQPDTGVHPLAVPTGRFVAVSAGPRHGCALAADGSVRCWGDNEAGQRGPQLRRAFEWIVGDAVCERDGLLSPVRCVRWADGEPIPRDDPGHPYAGAPDDQVDPLRGPFSDVWVTDAGSCASRIDGALVCWGDPGAAFDPALGPFTQMAAGRLHACGLRPDGAVACWALLDDSLLDAAPSTLDGAQRRLRDYHDEHWRDQDLAPEGRFTQIAAGETHTCGLDENGRIVCWGQPDGHPEPPQGRYTQLTAAAALSCASDGEGAALCWGQIEGVSVPPTRLSDEPATYALATASAHRPCVRDAASDMRCGQSATAAGPLWWVGPLTAVDARGNEICAIRRIDESVACWDTRLGTTTFSTDRLDAQAVLADGFSSRSCTLRADDVFECDGRLDRRTHPPQGDYTKIAVGSEHGCAIRTDRAVTCWGSDQSVEYYE